MTDQEEKRGKDKALYEWLRARVAKASERAADNLVWLIVIAIASAGGTIAAAAKRALSHWWIVAIAAGVILFLSLLGIVLAVIRKVRGERRDLRVEVAHLKGQLAEAESDFEHAQTSTEARGTLVYQMIEAIQEELAIVEYWELDALVERGVLGAVRGLLIRSEEDVRLSVLVPRSGDLNWRMRWAAGHSVQGVRNFDREIDKTIAGIAYRRNTILASGNVEADTRFTFERNPRATRDFTSQVVIPLRFGDRVIGAFSTISTFEDAFDDADVSFLKIVGAVLDLILALEADFERVRARLLTAGMESGGESAPRPTE